MEWTSAEVIAALEIVPQGEREFLILALSSTPGSVPFEFLAGLATDAPSGHQRGAAIHAMAHRFKAGAVEFFLGALNDRSKEVRLNAAVRISELATSSTDPTPFLAWWSRRASSRSLELSEVAIALEFGARTGTLAEIVTWLRRGSHHLAPGDLKELQHRHPALVDEAVPPDALALSVDDPSTFAWLRQWRDGPGDFGPPDEFMWQEIDDILRKARARGHA